jgi:hypothetical protein
VCPHLRYRFHDSAMEQVTRNGVVMRFLRQL